MHGELGSSLGSVITLKYDVNYHAHGMTMSCANSTRILCTLADFAVLRSRDTYCSGFTWIIAASCSNCRGDSCKFLLNEPIALQTILESIRPTMLCLDSAMMDFLRLVRLGG